MKAILFFFLLCISTIALASEPFHVVVDQVYDGDTFKTHVDLPPPLNVVYIRLNGIDTPEKGSRSKCNKEHDKAVLASNFLMEQLPVGSIVEISSYKWDKYGGRINATVTTSNGVNINKLMIDKKHAMPYSGQGEKYNWCQ